MITALLVGLAAGFALATAGYELVVLRRVRREYVATRKALSELAPLRSSQPVRSDLSDSSPSLPL